jgi:hypothetical protein
MWKHILEGITGSSVEELILPVKRHCSWSNVLVDGSVLFGFVVTASWLMR